MASFTPINKPNNGVLPGIVVRESTRQTLEGEGQEESDGELDISSLKKKKSRRPYAKCVKPVKFRKDELPGYLTPEQLLVYLPEDLYFDNLWRILGTFTKMYIGTTLTALCDTLIDTQNIRTREWSACSERAKLLDRTASQYMHDTEERRRPSSAQAGTDAEARADGLINADDYHRQRAMHQTLAALFTAYSHGLEATIVLRKVSGLIKKLFFRDKDRWHNARTREFLVQSYGATTATEKKEALQRALSLLANFGGSEPLGAQCILRAFLPYLQAIDEVDSDVKRRLGIVHQYLERTEIRSMEGLQDWKPSPSGQALSEAGSSSQAWVDIFRPEEELANRQDALATLDVLRGVQTSSVADVQEVADIYGIFTDQGIDLPDGLSVAICTSLAAGNMVALNVAVLLLDAVGDWLSEASAGEAKWASGAFEASMRKMLQPVSKRLEEAGGLKNQR